MLTFDPGGGLTQKSKGLIALAQNTIHKCRVATPLLVFPVKEAIPAGTNNILHPPYGGVAIFARPCPPKPEHGFVESRVVKTMEDLEALRLETLAANEDSEIMLMHKIDASHNMIWTPGLLTIGKGHDGATAGRDTVSFPLAGMSGFTQAFLAKAGVPPSKAPYVEAVRNTSNNYTYLTQLRAGPVLDIIAEDYVPEDIEVTEVIQTDGEDLLAWAKRIKAIKTAATPGVIIYHPGGCLTDHYTVHCRENHVPILLTRKPLVGEVILATKALPDPDPEAMKLGVVAGSLMKLHDHRAEAIYMALTALHNSAALRGSYSFWLGAAASIIIKLGSAALRGEARHAHKATSKIRGDIYDHYAPRSLSFHRAGLSRVTQILTYGFGDPETNKSYGGKKWGLCGASMAPLFNAVRDLFIAPSPESASILTTALNLVINQAHNGGWWLNKFASIAAYVEIPKGHLQFILEGSVVLPDVMAMKPDAEKVLDKFTKEVQAWPVTAIDHLRFRKATLDVSPSAFFLHVKAATVPAPMTITIPVSPDLMSKLASSIGRVDIKDGAITLVTPDDATIPIWKEVELAPDSSTK